MDRRSIRLQILGLLREGKRSVGELVIELSHPQPTFPTTSRLRWCGFVGPERRGKRVYYTCRTSASPGDRLTGAARRVIGSFGYPKLQRAL